MKFIEVLFTLFLALISSAALSDCLQSDEVYELHCNEIASGMRVKLHALDSLRKNAKEQAKDAIGWLEKTVMMDMTSLSSLSGKAACNTQNVKSAMQNARKYFSANIETNSPSKPK